LGIKPFFFIKGADAFIVFNIRIHGEKTAGAVIAVTVKGKQFGGIN
jgi:hypothetical protein